MKVPAVVTLVALAVGCRAAPPERLTRPRRIPTPAIEASRSFVVPLVDRPEPLDALWPAAAVDELAPAILAVLPREPFAVQPGRPSAGGPALRLANLALARGDALDASAQYRAILVDAPPSYATYVRWRLARAYLALDRPDQAVPLLREVARSWRPESWAALLTLAELATAQRGAVAAMAELRSLAGGQTDELEAKLIHVGDRAGRVALLLARAARAPAGDQRCACALAAIELDPAALDDDAAQACQVALDRGDLSAEAPQVAQAFARRAAPTRQLALLRHATLDWRALARSPQAAQATPDRWLAIARTYLAAYQSEQTTALAELASWGAVATLSNAARIAARDRVVGDALVALTDAMAAEVAPAHRPYAAAIREVLSRQAAAPAR